MFGTLRVRRDRLDAREREIYRAAFCASCHALAELGGRLSALTTNWDQTALTLVVAGLQPARELAIEGRPCTALPFRTVPVQSIDPRGRALVAALNLAAVAAKLRDDVDDERSVLRRLALWLARGPERTSHATLRRLGFPVSMFVELPARQRAVEGAARRGSGTFEALAAPSVELVGQIFARAADVTDRPALAPDLRALGEALGRFTYAWDAWRDLRDDVRLGRFNAWVAVLGPRFDAGPVRAGLLADLDRAEAALRRLPPGAQLRVLGHVLATLREQVERGVPVGGGPVDVREGRLRQAGDCDVCACGEGCDCVAVDCCSTGAGSAPEAAGARSCCSGADCCGSACGDLCCFWTEGSQGRRMTRAERKRRRRGEAFGAVDLKPLLGKVGAATTDLLPAGRVRVLELDYDAVADAGDGRADAAIPQGAPIFVLGIGEDRLIVGRADLSGVTGVARVAAAP